MRAAREQVHSLAGIRPISRYLLRRAQAREQSSLTRGHSLTFAIHFMSRMQPESTSFLPARGHSPYQSAQRVKISHARMEILTLCTSWHGSLYFRKLSHIQIIISPFFFHQLFRTSLLYNTSIIYYKNSVRILNGR